MPDVDPADAPCALTLPAGWRRVANPAGLATWQKDGASGALQISTLPLAHGTDLRAWMDEAARTAGWTVTQKEAGDCAYGALAKVTMADPEFAVVQRWVLTGDVAESLLVSWIAPAPEPVATGEADAIVASIEPASTTQRALRIGVAIARSLVARDGNAPSAYFVLEADYRVREERLPDVSNAVGHAAAVSVIRSDASSASALAIVAMTVIPPGPGDEHDPFAVFVVEARFSETGAERLVADAPLLRMTDGELRLGAAERCEVDPVPELAGFLLSPSCP
jgi:hypothetical protein